MISTERSDVAYTYYHLTMVCWRGSLSGISFWGSKWLIIVCSYFYLDLRGFSSVISLIFFFVFSCLFNYFDPYRNLSLDGLFGFVSSLCYRVIDCQGCVSFCLLFSKCNSSSALSSIAGILFFHLILSASDASHCVFYLVG